MLGYGWPSLHAALNDLPAALLLVSVLFDLLGAVNKRDSLKAAGFWTLVVGVIGGAAAVGSGLMAEEGIEHSERAHAVMETHETLAFIVLALFGLLAIWRLVRRGVWSAKEQPVALTAGVIGVALLVYTAKLGGNLVFEHAAGIPSATMQAVQRDRGTEHEHAPGEEHEDAVPVRAPGADSARAPGTPADSATAAVDSAKAAHDATPHRHE